jgi:hypothetical protein
MRGQRNLGVYGVPSMLTVAFTLQYFGQGWAYNVFGKRSMKPRLIDASALGPDGVSSMRSATMDPRMIFAVILRGTCR